MTLNLCCDEAHHLRGVILPSALNKVENAKVFVDLSCIDLVTSRVTECIEALERVTDERQAEVGVIGLARSLGRGAHLRGCVDLRDLVDGEVLRVDSAGELGLEGSADLAKTFPVDSTKEWVLLQLLRSAHVTKTVLWVTDQAAIC